MYWTAAVGLSAAHWPTRLNFTASSAQLLGRMTAFAADVNQLTMKRTWKVCLYTFKSAAVSIVS